MFKDPFLQKILAVAQTDNSIVSIWLYGSRANGTAYAESDYDLAVAFETFDKDPLARRLRPEYLVIEWA